MQDKSHSAFDRNLIQILLQFLLSHQLNALMIEFLRGSSGYLQVFIFIGVCQERAVYLEIVDEEKHCLYLVKAMLVKLLHLGHLYFYSTLSNICIS